jgi:hypothetical protein
MRSMAIRNADIRNRRAALAIAFVAIAFLVVSKWDAEALEEMRAVAANAPASAARYVAGLKQQALMYAVEEAGHREYFASGLHCRVPLRGERLVMQHAAPADPGKGYRCVYWLPSQPAIATATWSRSPELVQALPLGRTR